ncbi:MAG: hypothetical protein NTV51_00720 [Verrucomicrobia bacterium]|nr:hypothetical protein [Verrucomicrobiota bacterium]
MTQRVFVALLTVVVFLAGYGARGFTDRGGPVPPPPATLTQEYGVRPNAKPVDAKAAQKLDRAKLLAEIEKLRPQIVAYTAQVAEIDAEFEREFTALLVPEQRERYNANSKKRLELDAKRRAETSILSDEDITRERDRPLTDIYRQVTVTPRLEWMTKEYKLDAAQQTKTRALLSLRRNQFIALLDSTAHPTIRLSRLAPLVQRVATPAK